MLETIFELSEQSRSDIDGELRDLSFIENHDNI